MSNNMYVYTTSQQDVLYVSYEGDLRLIAHPDQQELIEMGMEAVGVDLVRIEGPNPDIEMDYEVIDDAVGDKFAERIMAFVGEEDE